MQVILHGQSYIVNNNAMKTETVALLHDDDTVALYIAQNRKQINDYDTILLVNTKRRTLFPIFLSIFNEMVEPYYTPLICSFPEFYIIESDAVDFAACDYRGISKLSQHVTNKYIAYAVVDKTLLIAPDLNETFAMFGNKRAISLPQPKIEKQMIYETTVDRKQTVTQSAKTQTPPVVQRPVINTPTKPVEATPSRNIPIQPVSPQRPTIPAQKPVQPQPTQIKRNGPLRENLLKYCEINDNCTVLNLSGNREIAVIDKRVGTIKRFNLDDLLSNEMIGYDNELALVMALGKSINIMYNTNKICFIDIRNAIRMFESRKESPVSKQMVSFNNDTIYFVLASEDALDKQTTIKNFAIECHKNAVINYEKIKSVTKAYAKDLYCIVTKTNIGILVVSDNGKKANYVPVDEIYNAMPELKNIGDVLRLFPVEKIIDATHFDVENISYVKSVVDVLPASMNLASDKYSIKGINIGYDKNAQVIVKAPVTTI